ncbi:MAG TPA: hypothetical protein VMM35_04000, partial [Longimicrobiales bacterium]|nr:hypothetical protein [Longimicrobiales bacterium]
DTRAAGRATTLTLYDASGAPTVQELVSDGKRRPDTRLLLAGDGSVRTQCQDTSGNGRFDASYRFENGVTREGLVDTGGDGAADQRLVYENGQVARVDVDTNGDGRVDVIQYMAGGNVVRQCEDSTFDGEIDRCFEGQTVVPVSGVTDVSARLPKLDCGSFHAFWRR